MRVRRVVLKKFIKVFFLHLWVKLEWGTASIDFNPKNLKGRGEQVLKRHENTVSHLQSVISLTSCKKCAERLEQMSCPTEKELMNVWTARKNGGALGTVSTGDNKCVHRLKRQRHQFLVAEGLRMLMRVKLKACDHLALHIDGRLIPNFVTKKSEIASTGPRRSNTQQKTP